MLGKITLHDCYYYWLDYIVIKIEDPFLLLPEIMPSTEIADPFPPTDLRSSSLNLRILISTVRNFLS